MMLYPLMETRIFAPATSPLPVPDPAYSFSPYGASHVRSPYCICNMQSSSNRIELPHWGISRECYLVAAGGRLLGDLRRIVQEPLQPDVGQGVLRHLLQHVERQRDDIGPEFSRRSEEHT